MKVLKFGGSVLNSPQDINNVKSIIDKQKSEVIVVISAFGETTNNLNSVANTASLRNNSYIDLLNNIK